MICTKDLTYEKALVPKPYILKAQSGHPKGPFRAYLCIKRAFSSKVGPH